MSQTSVLVHSQANTNSPPRKVIIGTTMERFPGKYPGLEKRLDQIAELIDETAREAERKYPGEGLDLIVMPEEVVTRGKGTTAAAKSAQLEGSVLNKMGAKAREYGTYLIVPMVLAEDGQKGIYTNAAVLIDRSGKVAGIYRKVHVVAPLGSDVLESGITPGREFPVFDCDFGKLGIQICFDLCYRDGWETLARKGAEIVAVPTMSPQTYRPAAHAANGRYYVVTSTPRNNAAVFNPVGMIDAQITEGRVLVHKIDLSYVILNWAAHLRDGKLFTDKYGDRTGYTYYRSEDAGIFWSNDPNTPIDAMVRELGFSDVKDEYERVRKLQDKARGGPPERVTGSGSENAFFEEKDIFTSGLDGYHTFRIPAVVVSTKGTILAFCEGRTKSISDAGDIDLVLKRSFDNGAVWQPMQLVWDDGVNTCGNPCPVVDRETGTIWLLSTHNPGTDHEGKIWDGTSKGTRTVWALKSTDNGTTWSDPVEITATAKESDWTWYATGPGVGIQLAGGRLIIPCDHGVAVTRDYHSHVIYSDDHGKTWKLGGTVPDKTTSESQVVECADGSLLINIRNHPEKSGCRTIAASKDGGLTWSETSLDHVLIGPGCQASLLRYTDEKRHDGNRMIFSNPADSRERIRMTVRLSYDEGESWPVSRLIHEGPSSYSCLTVLPDMTIACMYEGGEQHRREKIALARFNLEWLTNGMDALK